MNLWSTRRFSLESGEIPMLTIGLILSTSSSKQKDETKQKEEKKTIQKFYVVQCASEQHYTSGDREPDIFPMTYNSTSNNNILDECDLIFSRKMPRTLSIDIFVYVYIYCLLDSISCFWDTFLVRVMISVGTRARSATPPSAIDARKWKIQCINHPQWRRYLSRGNHRAHIEIYVMSDHFVRLWSISVGAAGAEQNAKRCNSNRSDRIIIVNIIGTLRSQFTWPLVSPHSSNYGWGNISTA